MDLKTFKEGSMRKFMEMKPEDSELFKYQTLFKDFEADPKIMEDAGIKVLQKPDGVEIKNLDGSSDLLGNFDINDKFAQMNNAFFNSGTLIEVPRGAAGTIRISSSPENDVFRKLVVLAGERSSIDIVKESYSPNENPGIVSEDVLVIAGPDSEITFSEFQNYNYNSAVFSNKIAVCKSNSKVSWNLGLFGGGKSRSRTYNFLEGDGSYVEDLQLTFGDKEQNFDAFSNLVHIGRSTTARALAKGVFKDKSSSIFKGMIRIKENAKNAGSYLACHGMLLSKSAKANAIPGLEIETNDVKATHAASVSPIDEEKIFYLLSRGIDEQSARRMITLGFFDPLIKGIKSDEIRAKIRYLIEMKWQGQNTESFEEKMLKEYMTEDAIKSGDIFEGHYKYR